MPSSRRRFLRDCVAAPAALAGSAGLWPAGPTEVAGRPGLRMELAFGGDCFLMSPLVARVPPGGDAVFRCLRQSNSSFVNLENGLSTVGHAGLGGFTQGRPLRGHPRLVADLTWAGVRAVSLANNHVGNYGRQALTETMRTLGAAGIAYAGAGRTLDEAWAPARIEVGGSQVAFLSAYSFYYSFGAADLASKAEPGVAFCRAYDVLLALGSSVDTRERDTPVILPLETPARHSVMAPLREDADRLVAAVRAARRGADLVIVALHFHWGREGHQDLPVHERALAHAAIDAGADVVVGHGPHVVHAAEVYRGKLIAYSLGNFLLEPSRRTATASQTGAVSSAPGQLTREGLLLRLVFDLANRRAVFLPLTIDDAGVPQVASPTSATPIIQRFMGLSAALGTAVRQEESYGCIEL